MKHFLNRSRKAVIGGLIASASAAGIIVSELEWEGIVAAFIVNAFAVWMTPNAKDGNNEIRPVEDWRD
jgi:hypothetical protein